MSYCTYLLWIALFNDPDEHCNSNYNSDSNDLWTWIGIIIAFVTLSFVATVVSLSTFYEPEEEEADPEEQARKKSNEALLDKAEREEEEAQDKADLAEETAEAKADAAQEKADAQRYSYMKFFLAMSLASMYLAMLLPGWGNLDDT